jgi:hypothetical protein
MKENSPVRNIYDRKYQKDGGNYLYTARSFSRPVGSLVLTSTVMLCSESQGTYDHIFLSHILYSSLNKPYEYGARIKEKILGKHRITVIGK